MATTTASASPVTDENENDVTLERQVHDEQQVREQEEYSLLSPSTTIPQQQQPKQQLPVKRRIKNWQWTLLLHLFGCVLYLLPLTTHPYDSNNPVLDELHVCSSENVDINGPLPFIDILQHDYWGRPMTAENSHKSWRPLTILSFRYLGGGGGRPAPNHHPLTSYLHRWIYTLTLHRLVNVLLHAATADLVALVATRLFLSITTTSTTTTEASLTHPTFVLYALVKLLFLLHPTHVEVTANAANRNHLLATMCSLLLILLMQQQQEESKPSTASSRIHLALLFLVWMPLILLFGFGASETFLFQIPAILVTATVLEFVRQQQRQEQGTTSTSSSSSSSSSSLAIFFHSLWNLRFRHLVVIFGAFSYAFGRYYFDTLKIPEGLLRPAENPFAHFQGWKRIWNYSYVTALHVMKSIGLDVVGFSHEYGERCIEPLRLRPFYGDLYDTNQGGGGSSEEANGLLVPEDNRMILPFLLLAVIVIITIYCISVATPTPTTTTESDDTTDNAHEDAVSHNPGNNSSNINLFPLLLWLMHLSWLVTLFPIAGFVKVGTFISDRIVVPSTVSVCILLGAALTKVLAWAVSHWKRTKRPLMLAPVVLFMTLLFGVMWRRIHIRSVQWMDSVPLLQSSLQTCPNFAKGHLEISKVYSGLYPAHFNLTKSRWHLQQVERIDPAYCDVHQQFAHVALQELNYVEFEERLVQAVLCPFTMGGAVEMWKRYWQAVLRPGTPEPQLREAQARQEKYSLQIQQAVAEQQQQQWQEKE